MIGLFLPGSWYGRLLWIGAFGRLDPTTAVDFLGIFDDRGLLHHPLDCGHVTDGTRVANISRFHGRCGGIRIFASGLEHGRTGAGE